MQCSLSYILSLSLLLYRTEESSLEELTVFAFLAHQADLWFRDRDDIALLQREEKVSFRSFLILANEAREFLPPSPSSLKLQSYDTKLLDRKYMYRRGWFVLLTYEDRKRE